MAARTSDGAAVAAGPDDDAGEVVDADAVLEGAVGGRPAYHGRRRRHAQHLHVNRRHRRIYNHTHTQPPHTTCSNLSNPALSSRVLTNCASRQGNAIGRVRLLPH